MCGQLLNCQSVLNMQPACCHRARAELAKIFAKIIATRRATGSKEDDMLQVN